MRRAKPNRPSGNAKPTWYDPRVDAARKRREAEGKKPYVVAGRLGDGMIVEYCEPVATDTGYTIDADIYCNGILVREEHGIQTGPEPKWTGDPHFFDACAMLFSTYMDEIEASARAKGAL